MRPIYSTPKVLVRFAHAGRLSALIGDWVTFFIDQSSASTMILHYRQRLPEKMEFVNKRWTHYLTRPGIIKPKLLYLVSCMNSSTRLSGMGTK